MTLKRVSPLSWVVPGTVGEVVPKPQPEDWVINPDRIALERGRGRATGGPVMAK